MSEWPLSDALRARINAMMPPLPKTLVVDGDTYREVATRVWSEQLRFKTSDGRVLFKGIELRTEDSMTDDAKTAQAIHAGLPTGHTALCDCVACDQRRVEGERFRRNAEYSAELSARKTSERERLRDEMAMAAIHGTAYTCAPENNYQLTLRAYDIADAMLKAREAK